MKFTTIKILIELTLKWLKKANGAFEKGVCYDSDKDLIKEYKQAPTDRYFEEKVVKQNM